MEITVYGTLRDVIGGKDIYITSVPEMTIAHVLKLTTAEEPALRDRVFDAASQLHPSIRVLVNGRDVRFLDGLKTRVIPEDTVRIFPAHGGGRREQL
jgi:molybdopterin converting factor small subunit